MRLFLIMATCTLLFGPAFLSWDFTEKQMVKVLTAILLFYFIVDNIVFATSSVVILSDFYSWKY